jgi:Sugar (and other) transporter
VQHLINFVHTLGGEEEVSMSWLPTVCILVYIVTSTLGFLTLPWVMVGEVFPADLRGVGGGLTTCSAYLVGFAVLKAYPSMRDVLHASGVFLVYGIVSLLGTAFVAVWLPETAGKTLAEVEQYFAGPEAMSAESLPVMTSSKPLLVQNGDDKNGGAVVV